MLICLESIANRYTPGVRGAAPPGGGLADRGAKRSPEKRYAMFSVLWAYRDLFWAYDP